MTEKATAPVRTEREPGDGSGQLLVLLVIGILGIILGLIIVLQSASNYDPSAGIAIGGGLFSLGVFAVLLRLVAGAIVSAIHSRR